MRIAQQNFVWFSIPQSLYSDNNCYKIVLVLVLVLVIEFPHKAAETRRRIREEYPPITQMAQILFRVEQAGEDGFCACAQNDARRCLSLWL